MYVEPEYLLPFWEQSYNFGQIVAVAAMAGWAVFWGMKHK